MSSKRRRGFFLIIVLLVIVVATLAAYSFTDLMLAYEESSYMVEDRGQTDLVVESGVEALRMMLTDSRDAREAAGGVHNNPLMFQAINVVADPDPARNANFTVIAPAMDETGQLAGIRYGLQNESAKLNLNALTTLDENAGGMMSLASELGLMDEATGEQMSLGQALLMGLPGMTPDIADAILDWLDADEEARPMGAESEFYLTMPSPYEPKNGPLDSVEELLLVRGVTPELLFGADHNRNGVIDAAEQALVPVDGRDVASLGWAAYLTVHSMEANRRSDGTPRIFVNNPDLEMLYDELVDALGNEDWASFIVAYRLAGASASGGGPGGGGPGGGGPGGGADSGDTDGGGGRGGAPDRGAGGGEGSIGLDPGGAADPFAADPFDDPPQRGGGQNGRGGEPPEPWTADALDHLDLTAEGQVEIGQLLDLIGATVTVTVPGDEEGEEESLVLASPFSENPLEMVFYMPALMENLTSHQFERMPGRINLNECPADLIRGMPVISFETAEAIIEARGIQSDSENRRYETWPLVEGLVTLEEMRRLMPLVTTGGDVFRAQVIGYFEGTTAFSRAEVIIDATGPNPRVVFWRDLGHLGRGFDAAVLGLRASGGGGAMGGFGGL